MARSASNTPRTIVCIHCQYERAVHDGLIVCPECGQRGLVHKHHLAPRMRRLRFWVWTEVCMVMLLVLAGCSTLVPGPLQIIVGLIPILLLMATLQGFIGIFIAGATFDRKGLHRNASLRNYTWVGMILSILLFCSIGITIGVGMLIEMIFG